MGYGDYETVFPAYAGMIPVESLERTALRRVPRIRGDDPELLEQMHDAAECSPHTRG